MGLARELKNKIWNMKMSVAHLVVGALEMVLKCLEKT